MSEYAGDASAVGDGEADEGAKGGGEELDVLVELPEGARPESSRRLIRAA